MSRRSSPTNSPAGSPQRPPIATAACACSTAGWRPKARSPLVQWPGCVRPQSRISRFLWCARTLSGGSWRPAPGLRGSPLQAEATHRAGDLGRARRLRSRPATSSPGSGPRPATGQGCSPLSRSQAGTLAVQRGGSGREVGPTARRSWSRGRVPLGALRNELLAADSHPPLHLKGTADARTGHRLHHLA
jgi:hypothetical protein